MEVELDEGPDESDWCTLFYCGIYKYVAGGGIINGEVGGTFSIGDLVEESEV